MTGAAVSNLERRSREFEAFKFGWYFRITRLQLTLKVLERLQGRNDSRCTFILQNHEMHKRLPILQDVGTVTNPGVIQSTQLLHYLSDILLVFLGKSGLHRVLDSINFHLAQFSAMQHETSHI